MFDYLFDPKIEEKGDYYVIRGVPFYQLSMDFQSAYGTSYITKAMLVKINNYSFRVHKFFMVEFHYTLMKVIHAKRLRTPLDKLIKLQYVVENETWFAETITPKIFDNFDKFKGEFHSAPDYNQEKFLREYGTITNAYFLKGLLLDAKAGSGKTFTTLFWSRMTGNKQTVIICPDGIIDSIWKAEIAKHFKKKPTVWTTIDGTEINDEADYIIIHYSALTSSWAPKLEKWLLDRAKRTKMAFNLIIDECHNFNDETAKRSQLVTAWSDMGLFNQVVPMSGTPLKAMGRECYTVFTLIDKLFAGNARKEFLALYGRSRENLNELLRHRIGRAKFTIPSINGMGPKPPVVTIPVDIPNAERYTLKNVRSEMMIYIEERVKFYYTHLDAYNRFFWECVNDFGEATRSNPSDEADYNRYVAIVKRFKLKGFRSFDAVDIRDNTFCKKYEEELMQWLPRDKAKLFKNIRSAVKYLGLKIRGEALGNVLGKMREEAATALIRYAGLPDLVRSAKKKTLIFSSYVNSVVYCAEYMKSEGFTPVAVYGETNHDRDDNLKLMESNPLLNPGVASYDSLKEGYHCIWANQIIMLNPPWRDYILEQVTARVWRKGQDTECWFWLLDLNTGDDLNISSRSIDILKWSAEQVDQLMSKAAGYGGNAEFSGVMGAEVYKAPWIIEEEATQPLYFNSNPFSIF